MSKKIMITMAVVVSIIATIGVLFYMKTKSSTINNEIITIDNLKTNDVVSGDNLEVKGKILPSWTYNGVFQTQLKDSNGMVLSTGRVIVKANTSDTTKVAFETNIGLLEVPKGRITLVIAPDNEAGDVEKTKTIEIPLWYK